MTYMFTTQITFIEQRETRLVIVYILKNGLYLQMLPIEHTIFGTVFVLTFVKTVYFSIKVL